MARYPQPIVPVDHVEPVPRRIRAELGGRVVLDTTNALYLWEWPAYPQFLIPAADVEPDALVDEGRESNLSRGRVARVGLRAGDVERAGAGRRYMESTIPGIVDTIRFDWAALDAWYEEDEQVFVHPRNPYSRVDALRSRRTVRVELDGLVLAETSSPVAVFETGLPPRWYIDRTAVDFTPPAPHRHGDRLPVQGADHRVLVGADRRGAVPRPRLDLPLPHGAVAADRGARGVLRREGGRVPRRCRAGASGHTVLVVGHTVRMTDDDGVAIAYDVLRPGTPVVDSDGAQVGTVHEVLDNKREHMFDGIVVSTPDGRRFVDAPEVGRITDQRVTLTIDRAAVSALPAPDAPTGSPVADTDSFVGRWRKRLGL